MHKTRHHGTKDVSSASKVRKVVAEGNKDRDTESYCTTRSRSQCSETNSHIHNVTSSQCSMSTEIELIARKRFLSDEAIQVPVKRYRRT